MTDPASSPADSDIVAVQQVSLREVDVPTASAAEAAARDEVWEAAAARNPTLFDGPVSLVADVVWNAAGGLELAWTRGRYRNFALRQVPGATSWLPALFVAVVQPTLDGRVVIGEMAGSTAAPGRWQLPGGTVDPPAAGQPLTPDGLRSHAALELAEEIGVEVPSAHLRLELAIGADLGNLGLLFTAPALDFDQVVQRYETLCAAEADRGHHPEFSRIMAAGPADLPGLEPRVQYLDQVVRRYDSRV